MRRAGVPATARGIVSEGCLRFGRALTAHRTVGGGSAVGCGGSPSGAGVVRSDLRAREACEMWPLKEPRSANGHPRAAKARLTERCSVTGGIEPPWTPATPRGSSRVNIWRLCFRPARGILVVASESLTDNRRRPSLPREESPGSAGQDAG